MQLKDLVKISSPKEVYKNFQNQDMINIQIYMFQQEKIKNTW